MGGGGYYLKWCPERPLGDFLHPYPHEMDPRAFVVWTQPPQLCFFYAPCWLIQELVHTI